MTGPDHGLGRRARLGAVLVVALLPLVGLAGCGKDAKALSVQGTPTPTVRPTGDPVLGRELTVSYQRLGKVGFTDQNLVIDNRAPFAVTASAHLVALDGAGKVLSGVKISTVYGTERNNQVLMPGENRDLVVFSGEGAGAVRDVRASEVLAARAGVEPAPKPLLAHVVDQDGNDLAVRLAGTGVEIRNGNAVAVQARVVFIIWTKPGPGESQQAQQVLELGGLTTVPAHGTATVTPSAAQAATISQYGLTNAESIKAFVSH